MRKREERTQIPATDSGPKPGDFPLGSLESRAAVRAILNRRAAQQATPDIYRASWVGRPHDEDFEILDYNTGLPVTSDTAVNATKPAHSPKQNEQLRAATTEALPVQTGMSEIARHELNEEFEILDL